MIRHHPDEALLLDYAAGAPSEGVALAVATHASLCTGCARQIEHLEAIGGVMLAAQAPAEGDVTASLVGLLARLDEAEPDTAVTRMEAADPATAGLPSPLARYLGRSIDRLPWTWVGGRLFEECRLPLATPELKASVFRVGAGKRLPKHTHRGREYTVVLAGGYRDGDDLFARGDFAAKDVTDQHQPIADADGPCLSLVVQEAPVRLSGLLGMLINPFLRS
jgi:anti-sigma factor, putative, ChrR family